jgi:hypothetical protein
MTMYGTVRSLNETMRRIGIIMPRKAVEVRKPIVEDKDLAAKKKLIEAARQGRVQGRPKETKPVMQKIESRPISKAKQLLEEIETLAKDLKQTVYGGSDAMEESLDILEAVKTFSNGVIKRYEWRQDPSSKKIATIFGIIRDEANQRREKITSREIAEDSVAKASSREVLRPFLEAVKKIKGSYPVNEAVLQKLEAKLAEKN